MNFKLQYKLEGGQAPTKSHDTDGGWDLYSAEDIVIKPSCREKINTGLRLFIPKGWVGLIWPRSGMSVNKGADVLAGVIDAGYTDVLQVCLYNTNPLKWYLDSNYYDDPLEEEVSEYTLISKGEDLVIKKGDRIAQILFHEVPDVELEEVDHIPDTERGEKGFGSSGS